MTGPINDGRSSPPVNCDRCGKIHNRCTGHSRRSGGGPCGRWPAPGAKVCSKHGGSAPQVKAAAARRVETARVAAVLQVYGVPDERDPDEVILEMFARTAGHVAYLLVRVQELEPEALTWGKTTEVVKGAGEFPGVDVTFAAGAQAVVELYDRERRLLLEIFKAIKATRLDERRLELARAQVAPQMAVVLGRAFARLGLSEEQQVMVPDVLRQEIEGFLAGGRVIEGSVHSG